MKFPPLNTNYFPLGGGLDLLTPAISMPPGKTISAQNYEPVIGVGYRRINGYERYDGHSLPSQASYWVATVNLTGAVVVGNTITGLTSGATGTVLATDTNLLILGAVTGTFTVESISNGATVGTVSSVIQENATTSSAHANYKHAAANLQRLNIGVVPGSGRIRGVWRYNNTWYAFRDNAGATAGDMYRATGSGWVQVTFGKEIQFTGAVGQVNDGNTITGATSGATATVTRAMLRAGAWTAAGVGTLILSGVTGNFTNGENIQVGGVTKVVASGTQTNITRQPGGTLEFCNANFTGSTNSTKMYGADGVNLAFEFDGTNYIPIRTGMTTDTPSHIVVHKYYLFLSFLGSVQLSGLGAPYSWTAILGAAEISTGSAVTAFNVQQGQATSGASLAIFTEGTTYILYGSSTSNFVLTPSFDDIGAFAYTVQSIGNDTLNLTNRGIQRLKTTQNYGNFEFASVSHLVQPLITAKRGLQTASTTLKTKNQYRVYFSDGTAIVVGLTGDKITGLLPLNYGIVVRCICTAEDTDGSEVTMFGSDNGYVYRENSGTSLDGSVIESWLRLPFNHLKSPQVRKRYRFAVLDVTADGYSEVSITYDLGYGTLDVAQGIAATSQPLTASASDWDSFTWDSFTWDSMSVNNPRISFDGIEKNLSLMFYSSRAQDNPHTLQGVTICFTPLPVIR